MFYECDTQSQLTISHKDGKLFLFGLYIVIHDFLQSQTTFQIISWRPCLSFESCAVSKYIFADFNRFKFLYGIFKHHHHVIFTFRDEKKKQTVKRFFQLYGMHSRGMHCFKFRLALLVSLTVDIMTIVTPTGGYLQHHSHRVIEMSCFYRIPSKLLLLIIIILVLKRN